MKTVNISVALEKSSPTKIQIGRQGENRATKVIFDCSVYAESFGPGTAYLFHQRAPDTCPYPVAIEQDGNTITWEVSASDTEFAGQGQCELRWHVDEVIAKTQVWITTVTEALAGTESEEVPEAAQGWVSKVLQAIADIGKVNDEVVKAAVAAYIAENGLPDTGGVGFTSWSYDTDTGYIHLYNEDGEEAIEPLYAPGLGFADLTEDELQQVNTILTRASNYAAQAGQAKEAASASAENATKSAQDAATSAERATQSASAAATSETNASKSASAAAADADLAKQYNDSALKAAGEAAQSLSGAQDAAETAQEAAQEAIAARDGFKVDTTLSQSGQAADAKAVGDALSSLSEEIAKLSSAGSGVNGSDYSFLTGLKYYALGDSVVDYQGTTANPETYSGIDLQGTVHTDETVVGYIQTIEKRYGLVCTNYGAAGHTIVGDYSTLMALDYSDVVLVTIAYGVNDARTSVPLGAVNDTDGTTFAGALNNILRKIYTDNPECRVLVLAPLQRLYVSDFGIATENANGNYLIDFVNMCKKVAEKRSTLCVDMYRDSGINQTNLSYYTREGVHPLNTGYLRMAGAIIPVLDGLFTIEYNPFGTMTSTDDTEQEEPDTGSGGDDSGEDTPPTEDAGSTVVELTDDMFINDGTIIDNYGSVFDTGKGHSYTDPIALVAGKTYTLTMPTASRGPTYCYITCNSTDFSTHNPCTGSGGETSETVTSSAGVERPLCKFTIVAPSTGTYYLWINKYVGFTASDISLSYL